jgi:hypothetical protein
MVDDDGLLQLQGLSKAIHCLKANPSAVSTEGFWGNFIQSESRLLVQVVVSRSNAELGQLENPLERCQVALSHFAEAPWYAVYRSSALRPILGLTGAVESVVSSRNVSTPLVSALSAMQGRVCFSPWITTLRGVELDAHDELAMSIWVGDWLGSTEFKDEVLAVRKLVEAAIPQLGFPDDVADRFWEVFVAEMSVHQRRSVRRGLGVRATLRKIAGARARRPAEEPILLSPSNSHHIGQRQVLDFCADDYWARESWAEGDIMRMASLVEVDTIELVDSRKKFLERMRAEGSDRP